MNHWRGDRVQVHRDWKSRGTAKGGGRRTAGSCRIRCISSCRSCISSCRDKRERHEILSARGIMHSPSVTTTIKTPVLRVHLYARRVVIIIIISISHHHHHHNHRHCLQCKLLCWRTMIRYGDSGAWPKQRQRKNNSENGQQRQR